MYDNTIIKSNNIVLKFFIPVLLVILLLYEKNKDYMFFHQFVEILCTTFGASLTMIAINRFNLRKNNLFTYIGLGFSMICIINIIHILSFNGGKTYEEELTFTLIMWIITNYLEYVVLILALIFHKRRTGYPKAILYYLIVAGALCSLLFSLYYITKSNINFYRRLAFIDINWIFIFAMFLVIIIAVIKDRSISKVGKNYIILYTVLIMVYENIARIVFKSYGGADTHVLLMVHIFKYLAYYCLFEGISKFLIQGTYSEMYDELKEMERDQKYYNSMLEKRMKLEIELQKMMELSKNKYDTLINSIPDSIIIFEYNKFSFMNYSAQKLLEHIYKNNSIISKLKLDEFIYSIKAFEIHDDEKADKNILHFSLGLNEGTRKLYDMKTEYINSKICVVLIRDVTDIGKIKSLKSELDGYFKDDKIKREFYTNISHELRTPINVIYSALQLNDLYLMEKNKDGLRKNNENIKKNCLRLIRTINNFIDTNKITEGYLFPDMRVYNIVDLVENVSLATLCYLDKFNIALTFDAEEEEIYVECDKELIERVILNLLSNSVKYGRAGGYIFISITCKNDYVDIVLSNDSKPISQQEQNFIFDKFSKTQYALNSRKEGSGLGLFISKALVELQNGDINLNSNKSGNEFILRFKRTEEYIEVDEMLIDANINGLKEKVDIEFSDIYA